LFPAGVDFSFVFGFSLSASESLMRAGSEPLVLNRFPQGLPCPFSLTLHPPQTLALCEGRGHNPFADHQWYSHQWSWEPNNKPSHHP